MAKLYRSNTKYGGDARNTMMKRTNGNAQKTEGKET